MTIFLSALLKPFVLLAWMVFCWVIVEGIRRLMPDCWLKRLLLLKVWDD